MPLSFTFISLTTEYTVTGSTCLQYKVSPSNSYKIAVVSTKLLSSPGKIIFLASLMLAFSTLFHRVHSLGLSGVNSTFTKITNVLQLVLNSITVPVIDWTRGRTIVMPSLDNPLNF
jgi:hypothetical protein